MIYNPGGGHLPRNSPMTWFEGFRNEHGFTSYPDNQTPVTFDKPLVIVSFFCLTVALATILATLGIRGRERWPSLLRACYAVGIGSIILVCIFSHSWMEGEIRMTSPYVYRSNLPFKGTVGLNVALREANITLHGVYMGASGNGNVYFVESLKWADYGKQWDQYISFLERGHPEPILKVVEFLSVDQGGLRWGRQMHQAGQFGEILLWTAFAFWILSNVLLMSVIVYGAYTFLMSGVTMVLSCVAYHSCQSGQPLVIPFGEAELYIQYGWSFWLTLIAGLVTTLLGALLVLFDYWMSDNVREFFGLEKLDDDEGAKEDCATFAEGRPLNLIDRRGSVVPPTDYQRRQSIFLEDGRRASFWDVPRRVITSRLGGSLTGSANMGFEGEDRQGGRMMNPIYGAEAVPTIPKEDYGDNEVKIDMEKVCLDGQTCSRKPSLAPLHEQRENSSNESNGTPGTDGSSASVITVVHAPTSTPKKQQKQQQTSRRRRDSGECIVHVEKQTSQSSLVDGREGRISRGSSSGSLFQDAADLRTRLSRSDLNLTKRPSVSSTGFQSDENTFSDSGNSSFKHCGVSEIASEQTKKNTSHYRKGSTSSTGSGKSSSSTTSTVSYSAASSSGRPSRSGSESGRPSSADSGRGTCDGDLHYQQQRALAKPTTRHDSSRGVASHGVTSIHIP